MLFKEKSLNALFFSASFLLITAIVLALLLLFFPVSQKDKYHYNIKQFDVEYSAGRYPSAFKYLESAAGLTHERRYWYQVLRRSYYLSEKTKDYNYFYRISKKAVRDLKGNEDFWAFFIASMLWKGDIEEAYESIDKLSSPEYDLLKAEIFLKYENLKYAGKPQSDDYGALKDQLKKNRDPVFFEHIGSMTHNSELLFDAALLLMKERKAEEAYNLVKTLDMKNIPLKACGLIAYDGGYYSEAASYFVTQNEIDKMNFNENWTLNQLIADSYYLQYRRNPQKDFLNKAEIYYEKAMNLNNMEYWEPIVNLSLMRKKNGKIKDSYFLAKKVLYVFPEDKSVIAFFVENFHDDQPVIAERVVESYLEKYPEDPDISLISLKYCKGDIPPDQYKAELWKLFNNNPDSVSISRFLLWYLIGLNDLEDAEILVSRCERMKNSGTWLPLYKSVMFAVKKDYENAEKILEDFGQKSDDWEAFYNLSIIDMVLKKTDQAQINIEIAENMLDQSAFNDPTEFLNILSNIRTIKAMIYVIYGQYEKAENEISAALEYNSRNVRAREILTVINTY